MKQKSANQKTSQRKPQDVDQAPSAGLNGLAIAPPAYGIGSVDRGLSESQVSRGAVTQRQADVTGTGGDAGAPAENKTGLPDNLKAGIESLSGLALDDVRVHYNSPKPAGLQAFAYTQGTEIHVAPGQERHLPHEAWHVVQQAQGRVKPTMQMKGGVPVDDDQGLEREADVMGAKAMQPKGGTHDPRPDPFSCVAVNSSIGLSVQRKRVNFASNELRNWDSNPRNMEKREREKPPYETSEKGYDLSLKSGLKLKAQMDNWTANLAILKDVEEIMRNVVRQVNTLDTKEGRRIVRKHAWNLKRRPEEEEIKGVASVPGLIKGTGRNLTMKGYKHHFEPKDRTSGPVDEMVLKTDPLEKPEQKLLGADFESEYKLFTRTFKVSSSFKRPWAEKALAANKHTPEPLSEIIWFQYKRALSNFEGDPGKRGNLETIRTSSIINIRTLDTFFWTNRGAEIFNSHGEVTSRPADEDFWALLGTPNGNSAAHLLLAHGVSMGASGIESITYNQFGMSVKYTLA